MTAIDPKSTLPWRVGEETARMGTVVSDQRTVAETIKTGHDAVDYYGGHLVAESLPPGFAEFIVQSVTENNRMRTALEDIGEYEGEGGSGTPWRDIVRDCGQKARDALAGIAVEPSVQGVSATEALRGIMALIESGDLQRNIANDGDVSAFLRQGMAITSALRKALDVLGEP